MLERTSGMPEKNIAERERKRFDLFLNLAVVAAEVYALTRGFAENGVRGFAYYTYLSNLVAFFACFACAAESCCAPQNEGLSPATLRLKFFAVTSLAVTVGVVLFALFPVFLLSSGMPGSFSLASFFLHAFCPILSAVSFFAFERGEKGEDLSFRDSVRAAFPTLFYGLTLLYLNFTHAFVGPYPFFEVYLHPRLAAFFCPLIPVAAFVFALVFRRRWLRA